MNFLRSLLPPTPQKNNAPDAKSLEALRYVVRMQPSILPPARVRHRLMTAVRNAPRPLPLWFVDAWTVAVTLACFLILWGVFQPGIVLGWQANPQPGSAFRIYRADSAGAAYTLLAEIPAGQQSAYRYVDSLLLPGATYQYRIQLANANGAPVQSSIVQASGWQILPGLLSIVLSSLVCGWLAGVWFNRVLIYPSKIGLQASV